MGIIAKKSGMYNRLSFDNIRPGTKLLVRSRKWWERNGTDISGMKGAEIEGYVFVEYMTRVCGQVVTVDSIIETDPERPYITIVEPDGNPNEYCWTPGMFECIVN